jgi:hypothetical protein
MAAAAVSVKGTKLWAGDCADANQLRGAAPSAERSEPPLAERALGAIPAGQKSPRLTVDKSHTATNQADFGQLISSQAANRRTRIWQRSRSRGAPRRITDRSPTKKPPPNRGGFFVSRCPAEGAPVRYSRAERLTYPGG